MSGRQTRTANDEHTELRRNAEHILGGSHRPTRGHVSSGLDESEYRQLASGHWSIRLGRRCRRPSLCRRRWRCRGRELDRIAALQGLGRTVDHLILWREAGRHLDAVAEVSAELNGLEYCLVAVAKHRDLNPVVG